MGGFNYNGFNSSGMNQQQQAANGVKATAGSSPSLGQMQQGMGGLMTNEGQQGAHDTFMSGLLGSFNPMFQGMIRSGFEALGMPVPPSSQPAPAPPPAAPVAPVVDDEEEEEPGSLLPINNAKKAAEIMEKARKVGGLFL